MGRPKLSARGRTVKRTFSLPLTLDKRLMKQARKYGEGSSEFIRTIIKKYLDEWAPEVRSPLD